MTTPKVNSSGQKELDRAQVTFEKFEESVNTLTVDRMNQAPLRETESQTKMSSKQIKNYDAPRLEPLRRINSKEPHSTDPKLIREREEGHEYIKCIVENKDIIGEAVEICSKKFAGDPATFWKVPVNKPVYIPKFLAKQLSECKYHRLTMQEGQVTNSDGMGTYMGAMTVNETRSRIECRPADTFNFGT